LGFISCECKLESGCAIAYSDPHSYTYCLCNGLLANNHCYTLNWPNQGSVSHLAKAGQVVTTEINFETREISYYLDEVFLGVAFTNVPKISMYAGLAV